MRILLSATWTLCLGVRDLCTALLTVNNICFRDRITHAAKISLWTHVSDVKDSLNQGYVAFVKMAEVASEMAMHKKFPRGKKTAILILLTGQI